MQVTAGGITPTFPISPVLLEASQSVAAMATVKPTKEP